MRWNFPILNLLFAGVARRRNQITCVVFVVWLTLIEQSKIADVCMYVFVCASNSHIFAVTNCTRYKVFQFFSSSPC